MKINKATPGRPGEDRVIDAPYVITDIQERIVQLKQEDIWNHNDRNGITVFKTGTFTIVLSCFHKDARLKHKGIDGVCTIQVLEGKAKLVTDVETTVLSEHQLVNLHPNIQHELEMLEETTLLITNSNS